LGFVERKSNVWLQDGLLVTRSLRHVIPGGGSIPIIDLIVCKRYPILYLEESSSTVSERGPHFMTESQNAHCQKEFEVMRQKCIDKASEAAQLKSMKEVDEMGPTEWKRMLSAVSPPDYYEKLTSFQRKEIDTWEERRGSMIQERTRKEITNILEEEDGLSRKSKRLLRVYVCSYSNHGSAKDHNAYKSIPAHHDHALLTIWDVSDNQVDLFQEGTAVRLKNLGVKSKRCDGMLQLHANARAMMEKITPQPSKEFLRLSGFKKRKYNNLLWAQLLSKQMEKSCLHCPEHDCIGYLLKVSIVIIGDGGGKRVYLYLTDESGFLIRVERDFYNLSDSCSSQWVCGSHDFRQGMILPIRDIRILPFDPVEGCAVGIWTESSSLGDLTNCERMFMLKEWCSSTSGKLICDNLLDKLGSHLPCFNKLPNTEAIVIGFVIAFKVHMSGKDHKIVNTTVDGFMGQSESSGTTFKIDIDTGKGRAIEAILPPKFVSDLLDVCLSDLKVDNMHLLENDVMQDLLALDLESLNKQICERNTLFSFELNGPKKLSDVCYEVAGIKRADILSTARLYLQSNIIPTGSREISV